MSPNNASLTNHSIITLLVSIIILSLSSQNRLDFLTTPINDLTIPIRQPLFTLHRIINTRIEFISNLPHQQRLIDDLKRQNAQLGLLAQRTEELKAENQALKKILSANTTPNYQTLPVKVIGLSRYAIINRGGNSGVAIGMPLVNEDILLGIVTNIFPNTSQVRLLADPETTIPVTTLNLADGNLTFSHNTLQLTQVPQKNTLNLEEPVFTTGSEIIPPNLLIGTIKRISSNESDIYQTAIIEPAASIAQHQHLFIILD